MVTCKAAGRRFFSSLAVLLAVGLTASQATAQSQTDQTSGADVNPTSEGAQDSTVVASYDGQAITLAEFERRYARTVGGPAEAAQDSAEAYEDFLSRYVDFRIKVRAAEMAGMRQDSSMQQEVAQYRANLARPYLLEQEVLDPIIRDLYERQQETIDASHILIQVPPNASSEDTLQAYNRIAAIVDSIQAGEDFGEMAALFSEDPSAQRPEGPGARGRLGYFPAGQMVAPFEDAAYATPEGELSPIFRTQFGYHVLTVHDRREAVPDVQLAHILIRPADSTQAAADSARALTDSLQNQIQAGADFAELARQYSGDTGSAERGGDIGVVPYTAPLVEPFKEVAFGLENVGDVSDVVETQFGYHLIKLLDRKAQPTYEEAYDDLKQQVARLPRTQEAEQAFARQVLDARGATVDTAAVLDVFADIPVDSVYFMLVSDTLSESVLARSVASLGDSTYTLRDVKAFAFGAQVPRAETTRDQVRAVMNAFLTEKALDYEAAALEERDEEFSTVMEEFRDGLLLFKLMEDSVWAAAGQDTAALETYFDAHADEYQYSERTRLIGLYSPSDSLLEATAARLDSNLTVADLAQEIQADSLAQLRIDTVMVSGESSSVYEEALALSTGERTELLPRQGGYAVFIRDGEEAARPMTFEEAISRVIADYQEVLEAQLLERLRSRYDVQLFPEKLTQAFADVGAASGDASTQPEQ